MGVVIFHFLTAIQGAYVHDPIHIEEFVYWFQDLVS